MRQARNTFAIIAFAAMFGCNVQAPATTPTTYQDRLQLHSTAATQTLTANLARRFADGYDDADIDVSEGRLQALLRELDATDIDYFTSIHVPARADLWAAPLALDGLAIIAHRQSPLENLSLIDLRNIFAGLEADDAASYGRDEPYEPLTFQANTDIQLEFQRMVMGATSITGNAMLVPDYDAMLRQIAANIGAIGYLPLAMVNDTVKALAIDGVLPDAQTMRDRVYPLRATIYVIGREQPPPAIYNFFGWIQGEAGQAIVAETHTPLP